MFGSGSAQTNTSTAGLFGSVPAAPYNPARPLFSNLGSPAAGTPSSAAQPVTQATGLGTINPGSNYTMNLLPRRACPQAILRSYKSGDFTDLIITCGPLVFHVHQLIVCSTCDFFRKSVGFEKKQDQNRISLPEDDPEMIRRLIAFCYLGNYDPCNDLAVGCFDSLKQYPSITTLAPACHSRYRRDGLFSSPDACACLMRNTNSVKQAVLSLKSKGVPSDYSTVNKPDHSVEVAEPLTIHATMYALADKYQVEGLADLARDKFESCLHHHANTSDFMNAVQITYSSTPETNRGLRDTVCQAFQKHFKVNISSIPGIEAKLDCIDDLSFLLIKAWPVKTEPEKPAAKPAAASSGIFFGPPAPANRPAAPPNSMGAFGTPRP